MVPAVADTGKPVVDERRPKTRSIQIRVEPNQTLAGIAMEYLGSSDVQSIRQIQTLNPKLVDPDHILVGQTIWLPGPTAAPVEENVMTPINVRHLP